MNVIQNQNNWDYHFSKEQYEKFTKEEIKELVSFYRTKLKDYPNSLETTKLCIKKLRSKFRKSRSK